ncbi:MAG: phosphoribosylformylglycinamidine synthase I [Candidatus Omnitrophota bacterium]|nr:phosphoribosylformylglycinamidine synthase I [Candidatus Omnitrophota bacterium]MBU1929355.1 phosphoribosylformylglycinamidine synthase I [Candidatus Omnitrophota bacterium]MBU2035647.1 phosphoribosylformylglycinamidine synthase I [Candidatus Omnitrophota bacterium]MBU2221917.1 phosphoribosylformylglycinamidine synthase I [Candidatus Omnitrophota bacterium]MBU2258911.1 phosphoribosylformylglycinamidine synthase I [Candidatus Omnitrophota bacterium]
MDKPRVCVLRTAGTNCDQETAFAFEKAGALAELVHINRLILRQSNLDNYHILALSGGFTYGDDIAAGKILANELRHRLVELVRRFIQRGKLIIGICNGFQVLVKSGLLPGNLDLDQEASLTINDSAKFEDRWVYLKSPGHKATKSQTKCVWTKGLPQVIYLPVAHGEGKFITMDNSVLERLKKNDQVVFKYSDQKGALSDYPDNPNGSQENIAGICDDTGRILGLMPHPERHIDVSQHPRRHNENKQNTEGDGLLIFRNGVEYAKKNL